MRENGGSTRRKWIVALACLGQFMVIVDVVIVLVALPSIHAGFGFSDAGLQWVVNAYTIVFGGLLLLGGRLGDLMGRRRTFLVGLGVFVAASVAAGVAPNADLLIAARVVQGVGAAILSPATLAIILGTYEAQEQRTKALAWWSAALAAGGVTGELLGGVLTELVSWRAVFLINLPIGLAVMIGSRIVMAESIGQGSWRTLDVAGAAVITTALTAFVFGVVQADAASWGSFTVLGPLVLAVVLLAVFLLIERRMARVPIVPLTIFRSRAITGANLAMALVNAGVFAMWYFVSLYLQEVLGFGPVETGLGLIPGSLAVVPASRLAGRLLPRVGARPILAAAGICVGAGLSWLSLLSADGSYVVDVLGPVVVTTTGLGLCYPAAAYAATSGVPDSQRGLASGLINTSRQIGGSIGLAALVTVAAVVTAAQHGVSNAEALATGYGRALLVGAVFALLAVFGAAIVPPAARREGETAPRAPVVD